MKRSITVLFMVLFLTALCSLDTQAREKINESNFDYEWYMRRHPELMDFTGDDPKQIYAFYKNVGEPNGWLGRVTAETLLNSNNFDYERYAAENQDIYQVLGFNRIALYEHYIENGIHEGRKGYSTNEEINARYRIYEIADQLMAPGMPEQEIVKAVHDWMCLNIAYAYEEYCNGAIPRSSYGITGAINDGRAVCQGYAETFQYFMDVLGIECRVIGGTAWNSLASGGHAWNKLKVDGQWYYIDVTWDDPVPDRAGRVRYDYYLTTDPTFGGNHKPDND